MHFSSLSKSGASITQSATSPLTGLSEIQACYYNSKFSPELLASSSAEDQAAEETSFLPLQLHTFIF